MSTVATGGKLLSANDLAALLGFGGKRPEKGVYEMVADGRISERRYRFHPARIQEKIDGGGFVKRDD